MKKILLLSLMMGMIFSLYAQEQTVTGRVIDETSSGLPGVNVLVKGTSIGSVTDIDGNFKIKVPENSTLVFSFIGYASQEIAVGSQSVINVTLSADTKTLSEVVVTALGISREKKSLSYSAQEVDGKEMTTVKDPSFVNALSGKTPGVFINKSGSGVGGSTRVVLRGNSSTRNNNVLYVIDGIPMNNVSNSQPNDVWGQGGPNGGTGGAGRDGGDLVNLNPEDIESMSVLKGASAAALYGSQAANGVILITTKKGKAGKTSVNFSSSLTTETALIKPDLQYKYGQTAIGSEDSWGGVVNAENHADDFFDKGRTWINAVSISGGNNIAQSYFSYANTDSKGILPTNTFERHNFNFKQTSSIFENKLDLSANINVVTEKAHNRPTSGMYFNPLTGLYFFPRGLDFNEYETNYEVFDQPRNVSLQNWVADRDIQQNPYWILNRNQNDDSKTRFLANFSASYKLTDWLTLKSRGSIDKAFSKYEQKVYASTQATLGDYNGRYVLQKTEATQYYGDIILAANKTFETLSISANFGMSRLQSDLETDFFDSKDAKLDIREGSEVPLGLLYANVFNIQNIGQPGNTAMQSGSSNRLNAVFGSLNIGINGFLFLDVTARNDWSSSLAFTNNSSFFYPSVGLTTVLTEIMDLGPLDLLKIRGSYAEVGNAVSPYDSNVANTITNAGVQKATTFVRPGDELKPERNKSFEVGFELQTLDNRLGLDFTYYNSKTIDQRILINADPTEHGANFYIKNAGEIQNKGFEVALTANPIKSEAFNWDVQLNYTRNRNSVPKLSDDLADGVFYVSAPGVNNYGLAISEGGSFGDIYGRRFQRNANGTIIVDDTGKPLAEEGSLQKIGNSNPDFQLSLNNTLSYKGITLKLLIDGRFGGDVLSMTEALNDEFGVSATSAAARDAGGVDIPAVYEDGSAYPGLLPAQVFYQGVGDRDGITEHYIYSATNIRLRELSLGYSIPKSIVEKLGPIKRANVSFVARNLFFFRNDAPFDPDVSMSTGTGMQGVHVFAIPSTRSYGFNLSLSL